MSNHNIGERRRAEGAARRERIRQWFTNHPGGTAKDCSRDLGIRPETIGRHRHAIQKEWRERRTVTVQSANGLRSAKPLLVTSETILAQLPEIVQELLASQRELSTKLAELSDRIENVSTLITKK